MRRCIVLFLIVGCAGFRAAAQRERIDSLLSAIKKPIADTMIMHVYYQLGKDYVHIDGDSSVYFTQKALVLARKYGDVKREAESYSVLGVDEKNKGNFEKALSYDLQALRLKQKVNDEYGMAICYNDIGVLNKSMGRLDEALVNYKKSNELCRKIGLSKGISMTYNNIGTVYRETDRLDSALFFYELALKEAEKKEDPYSISTCLSNIGDVFIDKKKYEQALAIFRRCLGYDKANEDKQGISISYSNIARVLSSMKRYDEAVTYSDSSLALTDAEHLTRDRLSGLMIRTLIEEGNGKYGETVKYLKKYMGLKDSLMSEETNRQISELQTKYQTEQKEQQIALQQSEITRKNFVILGVVGIMLLTALLGYSSYRRYKLKQQAKLQETIIRQQELATHAVIEAEERERRRIAGDLHDGVGQLMSAARLNLSMAMTEAHFRDEKDREPFEKAIALVDEGCREVRSVSHNIMPNALLKSGLASAIREFISKIDERVLKVHLYTTGLNELMERNVESVLYRVVQECVANVIKHAGATQLDISLLIDESGISLTIEDNGKGFDTSDRSKFDGIGMKNIQSRVQYLKGTVEWDSSPGKGTVVMILIPAS